MDVEERAMNTEPAHEPELEALADLARKAVRDPSAARLAHGLEVVSGRLGHGRRRQRPLLLGLAAVGAATACALWAVVHLGLLSSHDQRGRATYEAPGEAAGEVAHFGYSVEGGTVAEGGYLRESGSGDMKLVFTGGTKLIFPRGSRGRLRSVGDGGVRIALEQGTASFDVTPHPHRRWLVEAGPFLVTVKGTAFTVSWDVAKERFELCLTRGRVAVSGPMSGGDINLEAGHLLAVDLARAETLITEIKPQTTTAEPRLGPAAPAAPALGPHGRDREHDHERSAGRDHDWSAALSAGRLDDILRDVAKAGLKVSLSRASEDELFALADAARYRRRTHWAREALLAVRRRFATSPRLVDTAYLLGRVEETSDRRIPEALRWYEGYLAASPQGTYAPEAMGRRMILVGKWAGAAAAKPLAEDYLRRFPNGTYAGSARALRRAL